MGRTVSKVEEVGTVAWIREDGSGDSKYIKELIIDLQRSRSTRRLLWFLTVTGAVGEESLKGS